MKNADRVLSGAGNTIRVRRPQCSIIAGPNDAGKTTFARDFLPRSVHCLEFVNSDLIALGLSPFDPTLAAVPAARLVLQRIHELARLGADFGMETTRSGRAYVRLFQELKTRGYRLRMISLWVPNPSLSPLRIRDRVRHGGQDVPPEDVLRRFPRSLANLRNLCAPLMDSLIFYDNAAKRPRRVFTEIAGRRKIADQALYCRIMEGQAP